MVAGSEQPTGDISDEEMRSLTQSILLRYGIDFTCYEPGSLRRRIRRVLSTFNLSSAHELWVKFLRDPKFVHEFMNEISVGMTSMFRDPVMWKSLKRYLLSWSGPKPISIWHAGCSTGEEVFSLGIVLRETNLQNSVRALATDFNQNAVKDAQQGVYHKLRMVENDSNFKQYSGFQELRQYYTPTGDDVVFDKSLIKHVEFAYHNLVNDSYRSGFDIILCRNVLIYFDTIAKGKVLNGFYNALNPGGLLIIGFFDTISHLIDPGKFTLIDDGAKIYRKR